MTQAKTTAAADVANARAASDGAVAALHHIRGLHRILVALSVASESDEPVTPDAGLYLTLAGIANAVSERLHSYMLEKEGMNEVDLLGKGDGQKEVRQ